MADITMTEVIELADPKLKAIAKRVLRTLQLEAEKAVAHHAEPANFPIATDPDSAEPIFLARFKELNPTKQQAAVVRAMASVKAPEAQRAAFYGDLSKVNLRTSTAVQAQARALPLPATLKFPMSHLNSLIQQPHGRVLVPHVVPAPPVRGRGLIPQQTTNKLELRIHKVWCMDETDPEFGGDDEIELGGSTVDESGDVKKVSAFTVRNDFDDGERQVYSPPRRFTQFGLTEGTTWPKSYFVTLVLCEKDMGGFNKFLNQLWAKVNGKVLEAVAAAVGAAIGSTVPGLGTIVGAAVGWVIGKLIGWIIGLFGDDVFMPFTVEVHIPSLNARWPGGRTDSPEGKIIYVGHGGVYELTFDWRLYA